MGTMGKALAVVNVVLAIAFLVLAALDYSKAQAWAFANLQADFAIAGLPVDDQEKDVEATPLVSYLTPKMMKELFGGNEDVKTQIDEVKKRQQQVKSAIDSEAEATKKEKILAILLPVMASQAERDALRNRTPDEIMGAEGEFNAVFKDATAGEQVGVEQRRQAIAHVLFTLGEQPAGYQERLLKIIGLGAYGREMEAQTLRLRNMIASLNNTIAAKETDFVKQYNDQLGQIIALRERILELDDTLRKQEKIKETHAGLLTARQQELAELQGQIKETEKKTQAALEEQSRLEKQLFDQQKLIGNTNDANRKLLQDITSKEQGR